MHVWRTLEIREGINWRWHAVVFSATLIAIFSRLPRALLHPQFFAEDGWVWYQQAYNLGWLRTLGITQAGYLQTLPRLAAGLALLFPMQWAPFIMNLAGAVVQVMPVTALLSRRCTPWGPLPVRMLMAVLYIVIPNAPEIHIVMTNAMWHLAVLQVLLAFSVPPLSWRGRVLDILLFGIGSVSGPFCMLLLPLVAVYYWVRRQSWTLCHPGSSVGRCPLADFLSRALSEKRVSPASWRDSPIVAADRGRQHFRQQHDGKRRRLLAALVAYQRCHRRIRYCHLRLGKLSSCAASVHRLHCLRAGSLAEGPSDHGQHNSLGGTRRCSRNPLLVLAVADVSLGSSLVRLGRKKRIAAICRGCCLVTDDHWNCQEMVLPAVSSRNVTLAQTWNVSRSLKTGEHMLFAVYDPLGRKMELIKH